MMKVIPLPKQAGLNRFEVRDGATIFDVRDKKSMDGWRWSCSCGLPECQHIAASKRKLFGRA